MPAEIILLAPLEESLEVPMLSSDRSSGEERRSQRRVVGGDGTLRQSVG
jgi:hypothetical protein